MNIEEKVTILQYKHEETFDNISDDKDLVTEAIKLTMIDFPDTPLDEATIIADGVLNLYLEMDVI